MCKVWTDISIELCSNTPRTTRRITVSFGRCPPPEESASHQFVPTIFRECFAPFSCEFWPQRVLRTICAVSGFENRCSQGPKIDHFLEEPNPGDRSRLVEKPPHLMPYYSSSFYILRIYALRVTPESLLASRSLRFAASAAQFSISRCLSWPEKQFYQINCDFHTFWIWVNFWSF